MEFEVAINQIPGVAITTEISGIHDNSAENHCILHTENISAARGETLTYLQLSASCFVYVQSYRTWKEPMFKARTCFATSIFVAALVPRLYLQPITVIGRKKADTCYVLHKL